MLTTASPEYLARGGDVANLPAGSIHRNPASGCDEVVAADMARTASQRGSNDAAHGATDAQIVVNADRTD